MHLDEAAARATLFGGLVASGWHTCCVLMRMLSDDFLGDASFMGAPGVEEVKWLAPIRPGERINARATVLETRPSRSRPDIGFVKFRFELVNAADQPVMTLIVSPMFGRRAANARRDPGREDHDVFRGLSRGRKEAARPPPLLRRGHQSLRGALRSAALPSRRGGGRALAFRPALRLGLAHRLRLDAAHDRLPPARG